MFSAALLQLQTVLKKQAEESQKRCLWVGILLYTLDATKEQKKISLLQFL